ncbi:hypothetical protein GE107_21070 [Cohnella sp. CFH 77786]|uniref:hypothetical protein n=1 Tax=Cohnella sp. CFH 77786 TaxID=2662265 RepID=UPI001C60C3C6|nr:hypothetical protein [Cohnella sp. CFH 77786]MBW5448542.1 hypothetical protein [Cohnella sp. CFH 77786]
MKTGTKGAMPGKWIVMLFLAAAFGIAVVWVSGSDRRPPPDPNAPREYTYGKFTAANGMELHYLRTEPSNVTPAVVNQNVVLTPYYGINGGFFYQSDLLSIAVVNDVPVYPEKNGYGDGGANVKYARGTLVWDGATGALSVQVVRQASELRVFDRSRYWAQGGISMLPGDEESWEEQAAAENAPYAEDERLRSAAAFDRDGQLYLIVSANKGTLRAFREAILEGFGQDVLADGIFLDGDGSSQLRSRQKELKGDGRPVVQMLRLLN